MYLGSCFTNDYHVICNACVLLSVRPSARILLLTRPSKERGVVLLRVLLHDTSEVVLVATQGDTETFQLRL